MDVAGVLVECEGKILVLKRRSDSSQPNTWALPAGKVESGEIPYEAACRELEEETGIAARNLEFVLRFDWQEVLFHTFRLSLDTCVEPSLTEHDDFLWVSPEELHTYDNLISGFRELLEEVYSVA